MQERTKSFNFKYFDIEVWKILKKEATDREISFKKLIEMILKEWIKNNIKKE